VSRTNSSKLLSKRVPKHERTAAAMAMNEDQLRQGQKLEAVGRLAGGIAHDFNNLLSVVLSYSRILLDSTPPDKPGHEELEEIHKAGERAAALTQQLLAFSRHQVLAPRVLDLNEVVSHLHNMLGRLLGEDVRLECKLSDALGKIRADRSQIEQVIMNLAINARDAMPRGGSLTLTTCPSELSDAERAELELGPGRHVSLQVDDTGVGMDEETQARAFEPFFSTKDQGKGTGLGLSTVFGIVKQTGGALRMQSAPGRGTTFRIFLPEAANSLAPQPFAFSVAAPRGHETVLLVEDEPQVRSVASRMLMRLGYSVLEAKSPEDALDVAEHAGLNIDVLLTDLVMPQMNGRELADRLIARHPKLKVMFMSGYTEDAVIQRGVAAHSVAFLPKPLTPDALAHSLRNVLDAT
jgi:two-component system cell cycle sensor histidine kinase/response regulator CckA